MGSKQSSTNPHIPHAPTEPQLRRYTEILVNLPGKPRMQILDWVSQFLSRYEGQSEAQEGLAREVYDFLDYYLQSRNLDRGVLVSCEIQEALLGEGRRQGLHSREEGGSGRGDRLTHTPETTSTAEGDQVDVDESEIVDLAKWRKASASDGNHQGSVEPARDEQSIMTVKSESSSVEDHRGQKRKAEDEQPTKPTTSKGNQRVGSLAELHKDLTKAKNQDLSARKLSRRRTSNTDGFDNLTREEKLAKIEVDWKQVQETRYRNGISYEAILEKFENEITVLQKDTSIDEQVDSE